MNKLRVWRIGNNISAEAAGRMIGVGRVQWYRIENGSRKMATDKVVDFSRVTGIDESYLRPDVFKKSKTRSKKEKSQ